MTNIYKMFAASGNSFDDNTQIGTTDNALSSNKAWLPTTTTTTPNFKSEDNTLWSTVNGIIWSAKVTKPSGTNNQFANIDASNATTKLQSAEILEITGTLPSGTAGGFKYKYRNPGDDINNNVNLNAGNDNSQALPSSVTTIKIVLNKVA